MSDFFFKKKKGQILRYLFIDVARMLELNTFEINMLKKRGGVGKNDYLGTQRIFANL